MVAFPAPAPMEYCGPCSSADPAPNKTNRSRDNHRFQAPKLTWLVLGDAMAQAVAHQVPLQ